MVWDTIHTNNKTIEFNYVSQDMEEGYPGELNVKVTYSLTDNNELIIDYEASSNKTTVINLTNHAFFNLNGEGNGSVLEHQLQINAIYYTPIDSSLIPTGILEDVVGTPFDFRNPTLISERINDDHIQLNYGRGYDHNFVLNNQKTDYPVHAASIIGDKSGILMQVYTQEPGIQFYSGNFMDGSNVLKSGAKNDYRTAFCLETQHFPDSPNQPAFPSTQLNPSDIYKTSTVYKFS
jgi:aldose 1-epimerase